MKNGLTCAPIQKTDLVMEDAFGPESGSQVLPGSDKGVHGVDRARPYHGGLHLDKSGLPDDAAAKRTDKVLLWLHDARLSDTEPSGERDSLVHFHNLAVSTLYRTRFPDRTPGTRSTTALHMRFAPTSED
jgi:hypothetical protein